MLINKADTALIYYWPCAANAYPSSPAGLATWHPPRAAGACAARGAAQSSPRVRLVADRRNCPRSRGTPPAGSAATSTNGLNPYMVTIYNDIVSACSAGGKKVKLVSGRRWFADEDGN